MKSLLASVLMHLIFTTTLSHAASDTDVSNIKAGKVVIEEGKITIVAMAEIHFIKNQNLELQGLRIKTDKTAFIIKRPPLRFNDPDGTHAGEREKTRNVLDDAWKMTLESAKALQDGKEVGRIGYYKPTVTHDGNLVRSIEGEGYLYPKGK